MASCHITWHCINGAENWLGTVIEANICPAHSSTFPLEEHWGLGTPAKDPEDPPVDPDVDVGRLQDLAVAVPHARPGRSLLTLLGQHGEAGTVSKV